jgi:flotillin
VNPVLIAAIAIVGALLLAVYSVAKLIVKVPPDELAVFTGGGKSGTGETRRNVTYVRGGRRVRIPLLHQVDWMSLKPMTVAVQLTDVFAGDNVQVSIDGVAVIGYGMDEQSAVTAATNFLHYTPEQIHAAVREVLIGQIRGVVANMTPEQLNQDRATLQEKLTEAANAEYLQFGMRVMSFQIQQISDNAGLFDALGKKRVADAVAQAEEDVAAAEKRARIAKAQADREAQQAEAEAAAKVAEAERDRDVRLAIARAETESERARTQQAGPLADAEAQQAVVEAQVAVEQREMQAKLALEAARLETRTKALEVDVVAEARAARLKAVEDAEAAKITTVKAAEAQAEALRAKAAADKAAAVLEGQGDAEAQTALAAARLAELEAEAAGDKAKRMAEADGTGALLSAQAAGQRELAEAMLVMDERAERVQLLQQLIPALESVVGAAAAPFGEIDSIMMIDSGGGEGGGTLERYSTSVPTAVGTAMTVLKSFGLDGLLTSLAGTGGNGTVDPASLRESVVSTIKGALSDPETRKVIAAALAEADAEEEAEPATE